MRWGGLGHRIRTAWRKKEFYASTKTKSLMHWILYSFHTLRCQYATKFTSLLARIFRFFFRHFTVTNCSDWFMNFQRMLIIIWKEHFFLMSYSFHGHFLPSFKKWQSENFTGHITITTVCCVYLYLMFKNASILWKNYYYRSNGISEANIFECV